MNLEKERGARVCWWMHAHCLCSLASGMDFSPSDSVAFAARPSLLAKVSKGASSATENHSQSTLVWRTRLTLGWCQSSPQTQARTVGVWERKHFFLC